MTQNAKIGSAIDASCRLPLLALFGGAALWLIVGLVLALVASLNFHMPAKFGDCPCLTYGRLQPAANDAILYGFAIPAALGVTLWIFTRLSEVELALPFVSLAAANIWHLGVFIGVAAILTGYSTGFAWLEFPRGASALLFAAFLLISVSALATFGARRERALQPPQWFLLAALFWFPWIYSTANLFLVAWPVRGVTQAVLDWWFSNNLIFIWLALAGLGIAFYFLSELAGRPFQRPYLAMFAFWTFILFGPWCGIPQGAPVPAWLPAASAVASILTVVPLIAIALVFGKTVCGAQVQCKGGPYCCVKFGTVAFHISALLFLSFGCPFVSRIVEFTWLGQAQTLLQILGFFAIVIYGAVYAVMPCVMNSELTFPKFVRVQHWLFMLGLALLVLPLAIGGIEQGLKLRNPAIPFTDVVQAALPFLRVSTTGLLLLLLGSLLFAANIFAMTLKWKFALVKSFIVLMKTPLQDAEVKP